MTASVAKKRGSGLRGRRLFEAALREVADFGSWTRGEDLTWANLARRLGVSRQALESRRPDEKEALREAVGKQKEALRKTDYGADSAKVVRRTLEERIEASKAETAQLRKELDCWIEKWVTVEYNCRRRHINADDILTPLAKPDRSSVVEKRS